VSLVTAASLALVGKNKNHTSKKAVWNWLLALLRGAFGADLGGKRPGFVLKGVLTAGSILPEGSRARATMFHLPPIDSLPPHERSERTGGHEVGHYYLAIDEYRELADGTGLPDEKWEAATNIPLEQRSTTFTAMGNRETLPDGTTRRRPAALRQGDDVLLVLQELYPGRPLPLFLRPGLD
jgi:hypothetical protein